MLRLQGPITRRSGPGVPSSKAKTRREGRKARGRDGSEEEASLPAGLGRPCPGFLASRALGLVALLATRPFHLCWRRPLCQHSTSAVRSRGRAVPGLGEREVAAFSSGWRAREKGPVATGRSVSFSHFQATWRRQSQGVRRGQRKRPPCWLLFCPNPDP